MIIPTRFWPSFLGFAVALINALEPSIAHFVADHPDVAVNGYALLTTIANAINPNKSSLTLPPASS